VYQAADCNVAVGHQPHSEVAALALLLDRLNPDWEGNDPVGDVTVMSSKTGKCVGHVPSVTECRNRLVESEVPEWVIDHSLNVALLAARVARRIKGARTGVTEAGAWLHDWGRADSDGIDHCHLGALRVARSGYHPALEHIVASHIGGGLTRAEARRLGLPEGDYLPRTLEALIVAGCDNLFQGSKRQTVTDCANRLDDIGLNQGAARVRRVHARLSRLAGVELDEL